MWIKNIIIINKKSNKSSIGSFNQKNPQAEFPEPHNPPSKSEIVIKL